MAVSRYMTLKQTRLDLTEEARALDLGAEAGQARFSAIEAQIASLDASLIQEEARREMERTAPTAPVITEQPSVRIRDRAIDKPWGFSTFGMTQAEFVAQYPTSLPPTHADHPRIRYVNAGLGEFLVGVHQVAMGQGADPRLRYQAAAQGAGELVGADGGFLVPKQMGDEIVLRLFGGDVLSRVRRRTITVGNSIELNVVDETSRATGSRHGAVQGYRLDEGGTITASRPKFAKLEWKPRKYAALGYATDELLADTSLLGQVMFDAFGDELRFLAEDDVINGTGSGTPQGLLIANALVSVSKETGQAAATFVYENAIKMHARLHARSRRDAVWLINQDVEPQLYTMSLSVGTGGVPVFLPPSGASGSPYATLLGHPILPIEYAATLGTVGDVILVDLNEYWFFDKGEPQQATSIHVAFTTDEQAFRVTYRADGRCRWISALTPYKGTGNTQSCCIALNTRA